MKQKSIDAVDKMLYNILYILEICPGGGMVDTSVLEADVARRESSSLSWGTIRSSIARRATYKPNLVQSGKPMILVNGSV